jgi:phosphoribosylformimino-5-aminoimidazole carboxamide ribotide isomerase
MTEKERNTKIEVIPAVDIRGGKCVRLYQGDYSKEIIFSDDPLDAALKWQSLGAPRLHIVDLDGAASGEILNLEIIRSIARVVMVPVQMGGGIRSMGVVETVLKAGVDRVILSTAAVENQAFVKEVCNRFGESVIVSLDVREGKIAVRGWHQSMDLAPIPFAREMVQLGVRRFVYTDITRDGTLTEPNFSAIAELIDAVRVPVIASGGISSLNHLKMLKKLGAEGAIIGRALYTGDINLKQALDVIGKM